MSEENVEIVRQHIEAFLDDAERSFSFVDPNVVLDQSRVGAVDSEVAHGHEAVGQAVRRHVGTFDEYAYEVERLTDLGSGAVVAVITETGRGKGSGVPVRRSYATLYTVIDAKIVRMTTFPSEEQALEAAGWDTSAHPLPDVPDRGQGRDAWVTHLGTYMSGWNEYSAEVKEIFEAGDAEVVVVLHETATMRDSGVALDRDLVHLWTVRDGRGTSRVFKTKAEALEAAGLRE